MDLDDLTYDAIINYIHDFESKDNDNLVDRNVIVHKLSRDSFNYLIEYSVKYQSRLTRISKWETKRIKIDIDGTDFLIYLRDAKIDTVFGKHKPPSSGFLPETFR